MKLLSRGDWIEGMDEGLRSVSRVDRIVEIDAGQNGEHIGLQACDQQFERGQRDREGERQRGAERDLAEAQEEFDRLANLRADQDSAMLDITLLRLRALLARVRGDDVVYRDLASRYRAMAESLGFEGHIAWAEATIESGE